jgi:hypothetical protein
VGKRKYIKTRGCKNAEPNGLKLEGRVVKHAVAPKASKSIMLIRKRKTIIQQEYGHCQILSAPPNCESVKYCAVRVTGKRRRLSKGLVTALHAIVMAAVAEFVEKHNVKDAMNIAIRN